MERLEASFDDKGEALGKGDSEVAKYDVWICEEGVLKISAWARQGLSNEQIAENIGVSRKTFQEWLKKFPELKEAVKNSKEVADIHVENALFKKCLGYTVKVAKHIKVRKVEYSDEGKRIGETEELVPVFDEVHVPADTNAQKFWLQHRKVARSQPKRWVSLPKRSQWLPPAESACRWICR